MLQKLAARIKANRELRRKLEALTDYTLIDRMYDDKKLNSTRRQTWPQSS